VIPACNEAEELESAVRSLLEENYPALHVILVDDRSTDTTGEIVDRLADEDPRVRGIHVTELPEGWLGKVHALQRGYEGSTGDFVLFTDADVHFERGTLRRAIALCEAEQLGHLAAIPMLLPGTFMYNMLMSIFYRHLLLVTRPWLVGRPDTKSFFGVGAFNLVRRSAFDETPGFEWLRLEVGDDMGLGVMMKRSGARCAVVTAYDLVWLRWYRTLRDANRGAEKAYASAFNCSPLRVLVGALTLLLIEVSPLVCLLPIVLDGVTAVAIAGVAATTINVISVTLLARWPLMPVLPALLTPLSAPSLSFAFLRVGFLGWRRGGIDWRGTHYPSCALREGKRIPFP
jgi:hypothetical protein